MNPETRTILWRIFWIILGLFVLAKSRNPGDFGRDSSVGLVAQ